MHRGAGLTQVALADGHVDLATRRVIRAGRPEARLSERESALLAYLVARPGQLVSRGELLSEVFGYHPEVASRAVDTVVRRLRVKLEPDPALPSLVLSVFGEGYRFEPPPAVEVRRLPSRRTSFVGRARERALGLAGLDAARVVTLVGPGGAGKTRLALEVAEVARAARVGFVALASARTDDDVVRAVAVALELAADEARSVDAWVARVGRALEARPCLLVLDNAEQVVEWVATMVERWRAGRFLVTSRRALALEDEVVVEVGALPDPEALALLEARWIDAGGRPWRDEDREAGVGLVRALDGLPLALELAAARARSLRPAQVLERIGERFRLLKQGARDVDERHTSLRAMLDWSWELLAEPERRALAELSVFPTSWPREAEAAVLTEPELVDALAGHSLVAIDGARADLAESVRAYAGDRARARGDWSPALIRHGKWALALATSLDRALDGPEPKRALDALQRELSHVLGIERVASVAPDLAVSAGVALTMFFQMRGPTDAHARLLDRLLALPVSTDDLRGRILRSRGLVRRLRGDLLGALEDLDQGVALLDDDAVARADRGMVLGDLGRFDDADAALSEALGRLTGQAWMTSLAAQAALRTMAGHPPADVIPLYERALAAAIELGAVRMTAGIRANLATCLLGAGRLDEAEAALLEGIEALEALGSERRMASALLSLAALRAGQGRLDEAEALSLRAEAILEAHGHLRMVALGRLNRAAGRLVLGDPVGGLALVESGLELVEALADRLLGYFGQAYRAALLAELGRVPEAREALAKARLLVAGRGGHDRGLLDVAGAFVDLADGQAERVAAVLRSDRTEWQDGARFLARALDARGLG